MRDVDGIFLRSDRVQLPNDYSLEQSDYTFIHLTHTIATRLVEGSVLVSISTRQLLVLFTSMKRRHGFPKSSLTPRLIAGREILLLRFSAWRRGARLTNVIFHSDTVGERMRERERETHDSRRLLEGKKERARPPGRSWRSRSRLWCKAHRPSQLSGENP